LSVIRDVDSDGLPEVVIGYNGGVLVADGLSGEAIWEVQNFPGVCVVRTISKGTADYIIVRYWSSSDGHMLSMLSTADGGVVWSCGVGVSGYPELNTIVVPDIDADGWPEVCVAGTSGTNSTGVTCIAGGTGYVLWSSVLHDAIGQNYTLTGRIIPVRSPLGNMIVASVGAPLTNEYSLFLLNGSTGGVVWRSDTPAFAEDVVYSESLDTLFVAELKVDTEATFTLLAMESTSGRVVWDLAFPHEIWRICPFTDLNGDGLDDILVTVWYNGGPVVALNSANGSTIWSTQLHPNYRPESIALVGDADVVQA